MGDRGNTGGRGVCGPMGNTGDRGNTGGRGYCGPRGHQGNQNTVRYGTRNFTQTSVGQGWWYSIRDQSDNIINTISGSCIIWLSCVIINKATSTVILNASLCVNNNATTYETQTVYVRPNQSTCVTWGMFYTNSSEVNFGCYLTPFSGTSLNLDCYMSGTVYKYN